MMNHKGMVKRSGWMVALFLLLFAMVSCHNEEMEQISPSDIRLRFSIVAVEEGIVSTRATADATINDVYVLVFDGNDDSAELKTWAAATPAGGGIYNATLDKSVTGGQMYVFANIEANMADGTGFPDHITLGELKSTLIVQLSMKGGGITQNPRFAPMVGGPQAYDPQGSDTPSFTLLRATAKVIVRDGSGNGSYVMVGANLGNVPTKGYVFAGVNKVTTTAHYAGLVSGSSYSIENMICGVLPDQPLETESLYMFESPAENESFVIIKGEYDGVVGYHRLDLIDKDEKYLNITRNYQYIINIKEIYTSGYRTAKEAMDNVASNREVNWSVEVVDPSSHDIVSNGKQYLGVSNSGLIIYQSGEIQGMVATTLSYTMDAGWLAGTVTAIGDGLSLSETLAKVWSMPLGDLKDKGIKINCTSAFISGQLVFRVGNLSKVVKITRNQNMPAVPNEMEFQNLSVGDCSQSGVIKSFIRFAEKSGEYMLDSDYDVYVSNTGDLYASILANVGYRNSVRERSGEFYVSSGKDEGRTKVVFYQEKMDVFSDQKQIEPYTYIATFHRWNQTAERVIRLQAGNNDAAFEWEAIVVAGQDFIQLSDSKSPDTGIGVDPYGAGDNPIFVTDEQIENNCQITDGKLIVKGRGSNVYFRVGMKGKLASNTSTPRYGLIALRHKGGNHLIYVRQGEKADYVMRPTDPIDNISGLTRTHAVKISPYNLTVPDDKKHLAYCDLDEHGGVWTDYPSQGGPLFLGKGYRAYNLFGFGASAIQWGPTNEMREMCPEGFWRVKDGVDRNVGRVEGSEIRQSFWLNPQNGEAQSAVHNLSRGYIADGYFDRRPIRKLVDKSSTDGQNVFTAYPAVVGEKIYTGYIGQLVYNPNNFASVFIPATGSISYKQLWYTGQEGNVWSSTLSSSDDIYWYFAVGYVTGETPLRFDNYRYGNASSYGFSIRGVTK